MSQKQLRYEWRKMIEEGYDNDLLEHQKKKDEERFVYQEKEPNSIEALGTNYQKQLSQ